MATHTSTVEGIKTFPAMKRGSVTLMRYLLLIDLRTFSPKCLAFFDEETFPSIFYDLPLFLGFNFA